VLRVAPQLLPPLLLFVLVRLLLVWAAAAVGFDPWSAHSWRRWDSGHYLAIATHGYEAFSCARIGGRPQDLCGNAAWFPLYPWLLRPLLAVGIPPEPAGAWVAGLGALGLLVALWNGFLRRLGTRGWLVLAMAAVFPGAVYQHALFPISIALLSLVLAGRSIAHRRWGMAGVFGLLFSLAYVTGVLLAPVQAAVAWLRTRAARPVLLAGGLPCLGFLAVLTLHRIELGRWDAFYRVLRKGLTGVARPLDAFVAIVAPVFDPGSDLR